MATALTVLVLALLVTGVATATVYALPIIQQADAAQAQNGGMMQSQSQLRQRDCSQSGEMAQNREVVQLRECTQNCYGAGEGTCACTQGDSETAMGETYQNQFCEQLGIRSRNRYGLNLEAEE